MRVGQQTVGREAVRNVQQLLRRHLGALPAAIACGDGRGGGGGGGQTKRQGWEREAAGGWNITSVIGEVHTVDCVYIKAQDLWCEGALRAWAAYERSE